MKSNENQTADGITSTEKSNDYHIPVLLIETVDGLNIRPDGVYVDCTFGGGGHSREILKRLGSAGKLFVFDQDINAKQNLPNDERVVFIQQNFRHLQKFLRVQKCLKVDGIIADLGVSSHQFDEADRGFSIRFDANLDMRMDRRQTRTAADLLETYSEQQLHKLFEIYGEVTNSKTLAKTIVSKRKISPLNTISQFKQAIQEVVKGNPNKYLAQVFQALRIEVNDEIGALKEMLSQSLKLLNKNGRLSVITFHSLEDRVVKNFMKNGSLEIVAVDDVYGSKPLSPLTVITKKPIVAGKEECVKNPRSRSAKLRVAEKIN
jgi:16S rRNA (cytosine1402-N4)-methyltransferase